MESSSNTGTYSYSFGILAAAITIVFSLTIHLFDFNNNFVFNITPVLVTSIASLLAFLKFRSGKKNEVKIKDALKISVGVFLICAILYQFYLLLFTYFTSNEIFNLKEVFFNNLPLSLIKQISYGMITGVLIGIMTGLFTKKR